MKRILPLLLVLSLGVTAYGCKDKSHNDDKKAGDTPNPGNPPPGQQEPGTNAPPTAEEMNTNPIEGIEAPTAAVEVGAYTDGPAWHPVLGVLFFTTPLDDGALLRMFPDGRRSTVRDGVRAQNTQPIGNAVTATGDLITVEARRIVRLVAGDGNPDVIAVNYSGAQQASGDAGAATADGQFDTLNDVVARKDGTLYVTDPGYFTPEPGPATNRIYRVDPTGKVAVEDTFEDVPRPNGITLSPDEKLLYVGFSLPAEGTMPFIRKYTVNEDGTLGEWTKFADIAPADSSPDGLAVDKAGNLYVATATGIEVYKPDGNPWGKVEVPEKPTTGVAFGGADLKTLYITTGGAKIWQIKPKLAGVGP